MRKLILAAGVAAMALGVGIPAVASPEFDAGYTAKFTTSKPSSSSGLRFSITFTDPGEEGGRPKQLRKAVILLHPGTRVDTSALTKCTASKEEIGSKGPAACPRASRVGVGEAAAFARPPNPPTKIEVDIVAINKAGKLALAFTTKDGNPITSTEGRYKGRTLTFSFPEGTAFNVSKLQLNLRAFTKGRGTRRERRYITSPRTCPRTKKWTNSAVFTFEDGTDATISSISRCRRPSS